MIQRRLGRQIRQHVRDLAAYGRARPTRPGPGRCGDAISSWALVIFLIDPAERDSSPQFAVSPMPQTLRSASSSGRLRTWTDSFSTSASSIARRGLGNHRAAVVVAEPFFEVVDDEAVSVSPSASSSSFFGVSDSFSTDHRCNHLDVLEELAPKALRRRPAPSQVTQLVPGKIATTWSSTDSGLYLRCLSSSDQAGTRSSWAFEVSSRSDANAANASSSRYCEIQTQRAGHPSSP